VCLDVFLHKRPSFFCQGEAKDGTILFPAMRQLVVQQVCMPNTCMKVESLSRLCAVGTEPPALCGSVAHAGNLISHPVRLLDTG